MRLVLLIIAAAFCAAELRAGAWPQPRGDGFASASVELSWPQDKAMRDIGDPTGRYTSLYVEYGLSDRVTLGLDLGRNRQGDGTAIVFARYPLWQGVGGTRLSAELGLGRIGDDNVLRPGLSLGYGWETGWLAIDAMAEIARGGTGSKLDVTWGRNLARGRKVMVQLHAGKPADGDAFLRVAPSLVLPLRGALMVQTGISYGLTGDNSARLKLGLWRKF